MAGLFGDIDMTKVMFGQDAVQVPAWAYVQDGGDGMVSFVGGSRVPGHPHPARYGSTRTHQFVVGELVIRPHLVIATDALRGDGLAGLALGAHDLAAMLAEGEVLRDPIGLAARLREQGW